MDWSRRHGMRKNLDVGRVLASWEGARKSVRNRRDVRRAAESCADALPRCRDISKRYPHSSNPGYPPRYRPSPEGPCQLPGLYGEGGRRRDGASASPGPASPGRVRPEAITSRLPDVVGCMSCGAGLERPPRGRKSGQVGGRNRRAGRLTGATLLLMRGDRHAPRSLRNAEGRTSSLITSGREVAGCWRAYPSPAGERGR